MTDSRAAAAGRRFPVVLDVLIRPCREDDLPALEWFGMFTRHRGLIRRVFDEHQRGEAIMLVAEVNGEASGQLWVDLAQDPETGVIWAMRVLPCLQRRGIGARMIATAEAMLLERGRTRAALTVETDNQRAQHLYERLGYELAGTVFATDPPEDGNDNGRMQWMLVKTLPQPQAARRRRRRSACAGPSAT